MKDEIERLQGVVNAEHIEASQLVKSATYAQEAAKAEAERKRLAEEKLQSVQSDMFAIRLW